MFKNIMASLFLLLVSMSVYAEPFDYPISLYKLTDMVHNETKKVEVLLPLNYDTSNIKNAEYMPNSFTFRHVPDGIILSIDTSVKEWTTIDIKGNPYKNIPSLTLYYGYGVIYKATYHYETIYPSILLDGSVSIDSLSSSYLKYIYLSIRKSLISSGYEASLFCKSLNCTLSTKNGNDITNVFITGGVKDLYLTISDTHTNNEYEQINFDVKKEKESAIDDALVPLLKK